MITLPDLPYPYDALAPAISADTMRTHHDKHHAKYVETTNKLAQEKGLRDQSLEEIILRAEREGWTKLFNNAAQAWNHAFFWVAMTPQYRPASADFEGLRDKFVTEGAEHFGSGWVWLVFEGDHIAVNTTHDGANMVGKDVAPLIACDVWEHAYYLDYKNDRETFLEKWWDQVANWAFAEQQLVAARAHREGWHFSRAA